MYGSIPSFICLIDARLGESLEDSTPASRYQPSSRPMQRRAPELEYGDAVEVHRVSQQGSVKMRGARTFVSEIFAYEWLGCGRSMNAISKCCTDRCGWDFWTRGSIPFSAPCTSRCGAGWGWRKPESPWKCRSVESLEIQKQDFHPSHRPWKSPSDFHIPTGSTIPL
jgi:hypothetical protein